MSTQLTTITSNDWETTLSSLYAKMKGIDLANMPNTIREKLLAYYFNIERQMAELEIKRQEDGGSDIPYSWAPITNKDELYERAVHYATVGLDMRIENHLYAMFRPSKQKDTKGVKRDVGYVCTLQEGYLGRKFVAEKYADADYLRTTIELVYSNDKVSVKKQSITNPVESYEFETPNYFDRGEFAGGFGYIQYQDATKNKFIGMTKAQMEKRREAAQMQNMWKGWYEEKAEATLINYVFHKRNFPRNPDRIDASVKRLEEMDVQYQLSLAEEQALLIDGEVINELPVLDVPPPVVVGEVDVPSEGANALLLSNPPIPTHISVESENLITDEQVQVLLNAAGGDKVKLAEVLGGFGYGKGKRPRVGDYERILNELQEF